MQQKGHEFLRGPTTRSLGSHEKDRHGYVEPLKHPLKKPIHPITSSQLLHVRNIYLREWLKCVVN